MNRQPNDKDDLLAENMEEAFLQLMMKQYTMQEGEDLLELEKTLPECSPTEEQQKQLEKDLLRCLEQAHSPVKKRRSQRFIPLLAAVIAILVVSLATAGAEKARILKFLHISDGVSTQYGIVDSDDQKYTFQYVPKDFVELDYDVSNIGTTVLFESRLDNLQYFCFSVYEYSQKVNIDTEDAEYIEKIQIGSLEGEISSKRGLISLVWIDPEIEEIYTLQTTLNRDEAIRIAENIKYK